MQTVVWHEPFEFLTGSIAGAIESIVGVVHSVMLENSLETTLVERTIVSHER